MEAHWLQREQETGREVVAPHSRQEETGRDDEGDSDGERYGGSSVSPRGENQIEEFYYEEKKKNLISEGPARGLDFVCLYYKCIY